MCTSENVVEKVKESTQNTTNHEMYEHRQAAIWLGPGNKIALSFKKLDVQTRDLIAEVLLQKNGSKKGGGAPLAFYHFVHT